MAAPFLLFGFKMEMNPFTGANTKIIKQTYLSVKEKGRKNTINPGPSALLIDHR